MDSLCYFLSDENIKKVATKLCASLSSRVSVILQITSTARQLVSKESVCWFGQEGKLLKPVDLIQVAKEKL